MSPVWSRVWGTSCSQLGNGSCPTSCYNPLNPRPSINGNVLDDFPLYIRTCGQAMNEFGCALKDSVPANSVIVKSTSNGTSYTLDIRIDMRTSATAVITFADLQGGYPISCTFTKGSSSGTASFNELNSLLEWLSQSLRR
jgi:hypothetical protein